MLRWVSGRAADEVAVVRRAASHPCAAKSRCLVDERINRVAQSTPMLQGSFIFTYLKRRIEDTEETEKKKGEPELKRKGFPNGLLNSSMLCTYPSFPLQISVQCGVPLCTPRV